MRKYIVYLLILAVLVIFFIALQKIITQKKETFIFAGLLYPGKLIGYKYENGDFTKVLIDDLSPEVVMDIKVGDIYNEGKSVIVAAINDPSYKSKRCIVKIYEKVKDGFKATVLDELKEIFCRDLEIGDAYNTGENVIVLGTHGWGMIKTYRWNKNEKRWESEIVAINITGEMDRNQSRLVLTQPLPYHTAVHTVEIGDVNGDGKNEIIASHGTPNTYLKGPPESWIGVYSYKNGKWEREIAGHLDNRQHRRVKIGKNIYGDDRNVIVSGTFPNAILITYEFKNGSWEKRIVDEHVGADNNKAIAVADFDNDGKDEIVVGTDPDGKVIYYDFTGKDFTKTEIDNLKKVLKIEKELAVAGFDAVAYDIDKDGQDEIIMAVVAVDPYLLTKEAREKGSSGWLESRDGALIIYKKVGENWVRKIIDRGPYWSLCVGEIY